MAADVTIVAGNGPPVEGIDLPPLNNVLVNVFLNPEAYERQDKELTPVPCSSLRSAAYLFEPAVTVSPPDVGGVSIGDVLPDGDVEQLVDYWRNCNNEADLANHFTPSGVVTAMRPKQAVDRLGTLMRLRIAEATYRDLGGQMDAANADKLLSKEAAKSVQFEKKRLQEALATVRALALEKLSAEPPVKYTTEKNQKISLSVKGSTMQVLREHLAGPKHDAVARLMDQKKEYERLNELSRSGK